jgi:hypothetical protein
MEPAERQLRELAADMDRAARRKGISQEEREDLPGQATSDCWQEGPQPRAKHVPPYARRC